MERKRFFSENVFKCLCLKNCPPPTFFSTYHGKCESCQMLLHTFPLLIGGIVDNVKLGVDRQLGDGEEHVLLLLHVQVQEGV